MAYRRWLDYFIALIWLVNGLYCKVLGLVPRHREIVARILGERFSGGITVLIGVAEILMAVWVLSGIKRRLCAVFQIGVVLMMNLMETFLVPDLLLWGRLNLLFACFFCLLVWIWGGLSNEKQQL